MKTDKELLQLAARAAGYHHLTEWSDKITDHDSEHYGQPALHAKGAGGQCKSFNAKISDGDALRLAVDLGLCISTAGEYLGGVDCSIIVGMSATESHDNDKHAATRRAIVRAASAIGEDME